MISVVVHAVLHSSSRIAGSCAPGRTGVAGFPFAKKSKLRFWKRESGDNPIHRVLFGALLTYS
jgi:hypothetical protein